MQVKFSTFQFIGDRRDVLADHLQSLGAIKLRASENVVVLEADASQSRGLEALRQREAEEGGRGFGDGEVEDLSSR
ncbi:hypothetical protein ACFX2C_010554 [Malus domestica]